MPRRQLPPQIRRVGVVDRRTGNTVVRYQVTADAGVDRDTGKRKQVRRRFLTEREARDELASIQAAVRAGTYVQPSKLTVDHAAAAWLHSKHSLKPSTLRGHETSLQALRDELGDVLVQQLTKADLDALIGRLRAGEVEGRKAWSPRSCNYLLYLVTAVLDDQLRQGHLIRNVGKLVDRVAGDPRRYRTLTAAEVEKILARDSRDRHLWSLALCGLRRGEIAGLRWSNVNLTDQDTGEGDDVLPARSIRISENRVALGKDRIEAGTPKSKASRRTLPLPADMLALLKAAKKRQAAEKLSLGPPYGPGEHVASDEAGRSYHPNLLTYRWDRMLTVLGIEHVRLHDARHSCATLMHLRGVPIAVIAAWLGHASAAFTMSTYAHSQDDALKAAAEGFTGVVTFGDTEASSRPS